jgi:hypothetical protein
MVVEGEPGALLTQARLWALHGSVAVRGRPPSV